MTLQEAIEARHSVRAYKELPLAEDVIKVLEEQIAILNSEGNLHIQLIQDEPKVEYQIIMPFLTVQVIREDRLIRT